MTHLTDFRFGMSILALVVVAAGSLAGASCIASRQSSRTVEAQGNLPDVAFESVWQRSDAPVADGSASRTWIWGPLETARDRVEDYAEAPDGRRDVRYFDKSRMELTDPDGDPDSPWFVTNGLLVVELMTGKRQIGDVAFEQRDPASIPVAGDPDSLTIPTYAALSALVDQPASPDGSAITQVAGRDGTLGDDPALAEHGVVAAHRVMVPGIDHQVASVFWEFMNSSGPVQIDGELHDDLLFSSPFFATGYPLTEAYWVTANLAGSEQAILFQAFERRVLTYTPGNPDGWKVESGNVGAHYYDWLYGSSPPATPAPTSTSEPTAVESATPQPSATPAPQLTATATEQPPVTSELIPIGDGAVDAWMRSVVRDAADRLWVVAIENNASTAGTGPGRLVIYRATTPGIPSDFELVASGVVESKSESGAITFADAAKDADDRLHIVWVDRGQAGVPVMYGVFDLASASWTVPGAGLDDTGLSGFGGNAGQGGVSIAFDQSGVLRVAYVAADNHTQIRVRERVAGEWSAAAEPLRRDGSFVWHPVLASAPDGTWHLAGYDATRREILAAQDTGQGWSAVDIVAEDVLGPEDIDQGPTMLVTPDGTPHVLYVDAGSYLRLRALRDGSWQEFDVGGDYFTHAPGLGLFADGTLIISGHDEFHPPHGMNIIYGGQSGWSAWEQLAPIEADGSAVFRWAGAFSEPSTGYVDLVFFDEDLNNDGVFDDQLLYYIAIPAPSD